MDCKQTHIYVEEREMRREKKVDGSRVACSSRLGETASAPIGWASVAINSVGARHCPAPAAASGCWNYKPCSYGIGKRFASSINFLGLDQGQPGQPGPRHWVPDQTRMTTMTGSTPRGPPPCAHHRPAGVPWLEGVQVEMSMVTRNLIDFYSIRIRIWVNF